MARSDEVVGEVVAVGIGVDLDRRVVLDQAVGLVEVGEAVEEPVEAVEAPLAAATSAGARRRTGRVLGQVPLADHVGRVAVRPEDLGQGHDVVGQLHGVAGEAGVGVGDGGRRRRRAVEPGEQRRPGRRAHRGGVEVGVLDTAARARASTFGVGISDCRSSRDRRSRGRRRARRRCWGRPSGARAAAATTARRWPSCAPPARRTRGSPGSRAAPHPSSSLIAAPWLPVVRSRRPSAERRRTAGIVPAGPEPRSTLAPRDRTPGVDRGARGLGPGGEIGAVALRHRGALPASGRVDRRLELPGRPEAVGRSPRARRGGRRWPGAGGSACSSPSARPASPSARSRPTPSPSVATPTASPTSSARSSSPPPRFLQYAEAGRAPRFAEAGRAPTPRAQWRVLTWEPWRIDWWATSVQFVGTLFFNVVDLRRHIAGHQSIAHQDHRIWMPDVLGSICFLVASLLWRGARPGTGGGAGAPGSIGGGSPRSTWSGRSPSASRPWRLRRARPTGSWSAWPWPTWAPSSERSASWSAALLAPARAHGRPRHRRRLTTGAPPPRVPEPHRTLGAGWPVRRTRAREPARSAARRCRCRPGRGW